MYEKPECPDLVLKSSEWTVSECVEKIVNLLIKKVGQSFPMYRLVARNTDFFLLILSLYYSFCVIYINWYSTLKILCIERLTKCF